MGNRIRQLREKRGLTQETLAIELEITQHAVYGVRRSPFCFRTAVFRSQRPPIFSQKITAYRVLILIVQCFVALFMMELADTSSLRIIAFQLSGSRCEHTMVLFLWDITKEINSHAHSRLSEYRHLYNGNIGKYIRYLNRCIGNLLRFNRRTAIIKDGMQSSENDTW